MEDGVPSDPSDNAQLRTIPVATGAITVSVNFPDGCTIPPALRFRQSVDGTTRFLVQNVDLEALFYGELASWGDIVPGIGTQSGPACASRPLRRIVRADSSGTTFMFKTWLLEIEPNRAAQGGPGWANLRAPFNNTAWPSDSGPTAVARASGNGGVARLVRDTDGSVGYVDLATARSEGFDKTGRRSLAGGGDTTSAEDTTYWLPLANGSGQYRDPTTSANSYRQQFATAERGANCSNVDYQNVPDQFDPTFGVWYFVEGVHAPAGYGICLLTYVMSWEDHCDAYGSSTAEQAKARTTFDYLNFVLSPAGQAVLRRNDYSALPPPIRNISSQSASFGIEPWRGFGGPCD